MSEFTLPETTDRQQIPGSMEALALVSDWMARNRADTCKLIADLKANHEKHGRLDLADPLNPPDGWQNWLPLAISWLESEWCSRHRAEYWAREIPDASWLIDLCQEAKYREGIADRRAWLNATLENILAHKTEAGDAWLTKYQHSPHALTREWGGTGCAKLKAALTDWTETAGGES